jgi:DNA-binding CsgD family transcriptional regulator
MDKMQAGLLEVLQAAADPAVDFHTHALGWLQGLLGFDGAVWGQGKVLPDGGLRIVGADLRDRPRALLDGYGDVAALDPVSARFLAAPRCLQNVSVRTTYRDRHLRLVGGYLRSNRVEHLLLCGVPQAPGGTLGWVTLYREDAARPFDEAEARVAAFAVPFVLLAERDHRAARPEPAPVVVTRLSPREREVAAAYAAGLDYKRTARALSLAPATVRSHLLAIFRKLDVHNKIELRRLLGE